MKLGTKINHQQQHFTVLLYCSFYMLLAVVMVAITVALLNTYDNRLDLQTQIIITGMYYYTNSMYSVFMNSYYLSLLAVKSRLLMLNNSIRFVHVRKKFSAFLYGILTLQKNICYFHIPIENIEKWRCGGYRTQRFDKTNGTYIRPSCRSGGNVKLLFFSAGIHVKSI